MDNTTTKEVALSTDLTQPPFEVYGNYHQRQLVAALIVIASAIGVLGNSLVLVAVLRTKYLRTVTNTFVVNLSVSDLILCVSIPPQAVAVLYKDGWPFEDAYWLCVLSPAVIILSGGNSVTNLALIAINRWIGITKPLPTALRVYTRRNIACMIAFSWALPLCVVLIPLLTEFGELGYEPLYRSCSWRKSNPNSAFYNLFVIICYFPVQFFIIAFCYISIYRYVVKTSRRMAQYHAETISGVLQSNYNQEIHKKLWLRRVAVTKNLACVVLAFYICLTPWCIALIPFKYDWSTRMTPYAGSLAFFNSCVNPIIYAISHPDFREAFGDMTKCKGTP